MLARSFAAALLASLAASTPALAVDVRIEIAGTVTALPTPTGPVVALPGDDWYFTAWYRDVENGMVTSNFTDGLEVVFQ